MFLPSRMSSLYFSIMAVFSLLVVLSRSPVHAVLSLCGVYLTGGLFLIALDHYFLAFTLIIVYVGAIAILFLFTVFILHLRPSTHVRGWMPVVAFMPLLLALPTRTSILSVFSLDWSHLAHRASDIHMLALALYQGYPLLVVLTGLLLLIVLIGIIQIHTSR